MSDPLPNLRPAVARLIRCALQARQVADTPSVARLVRHEFARRSRVERQRLVTTLALAAAHFAAAVPAEERERIFAVLDASDAQLSALAVSKLLRGER